MAIDNNDIIKKRLAARAAAKLNMPLPTGPSMGFGGGSAGDEANEFYVAEQIGRTMPLSQPVELKPEPQHGVADAFAPRDYAADDRAIMIREQMDRLNEAQGGGLVMLQQLQQFGSQPFTSQDGTTYYVEPEGKYLMIQPKDGDLKTVPVQAINSMLTTQAEQMKAAGVSFPQAQQQPAAAPVDQSEALSPTQRASQAMQSVLNNRIATKDVITSKADSETYALTDKISAEGMASISTPNALELDPDKAKGEVVRQMAEYGRDEGNNMVRELREHGGEIEHNAATYKVDGVLLSAHLSGIDQTFYYGADEIEQAVDTRQGELVAIDRWENGQSPALDLQARLAAEIVQGKPEDLKGAEIAQRPELASEQHAAEPAVGNQPQSKAVEAEVITGDRAVEVGRELYQAYNETDGRVAFLEKGEEPNVVNGREFSREGLNIKEVSADGEVSVYDGLDVGKGMEERFNELSAAYEAAVTAGTLTDAEPQGFKLNANEEAAQAPDYEDFADEAEAYDAELADKEFQPVENPENVAFGYDGPKAELSSSTPEKEQAAEQAKPTELETLKAQMEELQAKLAGYEKPQEQSQAQAPQQTEKAPEQQGQDQNNVVQFPTSAAQSANLGERVAASLAQEPQQTEAKGDVAGKDEVNDAAVADVIEGRTPSKIEQRMAAHKAEGRASKDYVIASREEIEAAVATVAKGQGMGKGM